MKDLDLMNDLAKLKGFENLKALLQSHYVQEQGTLEQISEDLHISAYHLKQLMHLLGISLRQKTLKRLEIPLKELKKLTLGQLAQKHSISRSKAWRLKQSAKLKKPIPPAAADEDI